MGRKTVLVDDFDGTDLPEDTEPISLSLGRTTYSLYLSEKNHGKLMEALTPYIENAETSATPTASRQTGRQGTATNAADKERLTKIRAWAQSSGFTYKNAAGEDTTLGDRGRIPDAVVKAYEEANA